MLEGLYVVGTPIGNLGDISPRALEVLEKCDFIAAEDPRVTIKLLNHFGIKTPMVSYHEHNKAEKGAAIIARISVSASHQPHGLEARIPQPWADAVLPGPDCAAQDASGDCARRFHAAHERG